MGAADAQRVGLWGAPTGGLRRILSLFAAIAALQAVVACGVVYLRAGTRAAADEGASQLTRPAHRETLSASTSPPTTIPPPPPPPPTPAMLQLDSKLQAALAGVQGCAVVRDSTNHVVDFQGGVPLAPASTQKLLVAAAALTDLGPDYRFTTSAVASSAPSNGTVSQLWLVGTGDPVLTTNAYAANWVTDPRYAGQPTTSLDALADQLATSGLHSVPGGIHGDDSLFSPTRFLPTWSQADIADGNANPMSALDLNQGSQGSTGQYVPATDPASYAAGQLGALLAARHVAVPPGAAPDAKAPSGVVLASIQSPPLSQIVSSMLRSSNNHTAEMLTLALGQRLEGDGSTAAGLRAVMHTDQGLGIPMAGLSLFDGSGLSPENRATCQALIAVIEQAAARPDLAAIPQGLAVAGETGTLLDWWHGSPIQGHLSAKTGSEGGVAAMAGVLDLGPPLNFAMILNGPGNLDGDEESLVAAMAAYPGA